MRFYNFLMIYDNWNENMTVNNNDLKLIIKGNVYDIVLLHPELHGKEVVSFGFYDGELTVRVKD